MRLFIAIEFPKAIQYPLEEFLAELTRQWPDPQHSLRWVRPNQFHLTLKFLGECDEERLPDLKAALDAATSGHKAFDLSLEGLGCFQSRDQLRVIWLGVREGGVAAQSLAADVEETFETVGFPKEKRPYHPHITLARAKDPYKASVFEDFTRRGSWPAIGPFQATHVSLIQSKLSPAGPTYTTVHPSAFKA